MTRIDFVSSCCDEWQGGMWYFCQVPIFRSRSFFWFPKGYTIDTASFVCCCTDLSSNDGGKDEQEKSRWQRHFFVVEYILVLFLHASVSLLNVWIWIIMVDPHSLNRKASVNKLGIKKMLDYQYNGQNP